MLVKKNMIENTHKKCPKCGNKIKQIPIKKINSTIMIELYCEKCDESETYFPELGQIKKGQASFF